MSGHPKHLSLRAYAAHRRAAGLTGGVINAVQEAIANGRLKASVTLDGKIRDAEQADAEWASTTKEEHVPDTGPAARGAAAGQPNALATARARREAAQADLRELELARHRSELIPTKDFDAYLARVEERQKELFSRCRNRLLGIATRARQRDPSLAPRQVALIDELVREALADLATPTATDV